VVVGGGIINGISERLSPRERIAEIIAGDPALTARWEGSLNLASKMVDNEGVPPGTRYDALRMLGLDPWEKRGEHLVRYLSKDTNAELQLGAASALVDMNSPPSTAALLSALPHLADRNRKLALESIMKDKERVSALLDAIERKQLAPAVLGPAVEAQLLEYSDPTLAARGKKALQR